MSQLEACPLCRTTLRSSSEQCPDCGGDLRPFIATQQRIGELTQLARQHIAQGLLDSAQRLLPRLSQLGTIPPEVLRELNARLALAAGNSGEARSLAQQLDGEDRAELLRQCDLLDAARLRARELYNSALWLARSGSFAAAALELEQAAAADPASPEVWQLKLKCELKARFYGRCYTSLAALDRLQARPAEFARLEALLPASAAA
jgi:Tfp pilus assembly protein PilF